MHTNHLHFLLISGACALPAACQPAASVDVIDVVDLGPLEASSAIKGRVGGQSLLVGEDSAWLYGDTSLAVEDQNGTTWLDNSWSFTADLDATDGLEGFSEPLDAVGAPAPLLAPTPREVAYEALHSGDGCEDPCGARLALWPGPAVVDTACDRILLHYVKVDTVPGEDSHDIVGTGIATWRSLDASPDRPAVRTGTQEPTLLFDNPGFGLPAATTIFENWLYTFVCGEGGGWDQGCRLARVDLDEVFDPTRWRLWDGQRWTRTSGDAAVLFAGAAAMSLQWSEQARSWLVVYAEPDGDSVMLRSAPTLLGPWSRELPLFSAQRSWNDDAPQAAVAHSEYTADLEGGWAEYVSYYRSPEDRRGEIRLVRVELEAR